jgi:uncharacterized membrane protein
VTRGKKNIPIFLVVLLISMIGGVIVGAISAFIAMVAAGGPLDLTFLLIPGFTTVFVKIFSKVFNHHYGYLQSVLIPALVLFSLHMLVTQRLLVGWHLNNAISSVIILSLMYGCCAFVKGRIKVPESDRPNSPSSPTSSF